MGNIRRRLEMSGPGRPLYREQETVYVLGRDEAAETQAPPHISTPLARTRSMTTRKLALTQPPHYITFELSESLICFFLSRGKHRVCINQVRAEYGQSVSARTSY